MITIVLNSSNEYAEYCGVMLTSLFETNKNNLFIIYILTTSISENNQKELYSLKEKYGNEIIIKTINDHYLKQLPIYFSYHSAAVYLKILASDILPINITKFLYLDSDIIINGDISKIWEIDISDHALAATKDLPRFLSKYKENLNLGNDDPYFNSGVMLVNTIYWRENRLADKALDFANNNSDKIIACDQDAMNATLKGTGKIKILNRSWNIYPDVFFVNPELFEEEMQEIEKIREQPTIIHFLYTKPWFKDCHHPYKKLFYTYYKSYKGQEFKAIKRKNSIKTLLKQSVKYLFFIVGAIDLYNVYDKKYAKGLDRLAW